MNNILSMKRNKWMYRVTQGALIGFLLCSSVGTPSLEAAVPKLQTIRVALLGEYTINYKAPTSLATLSSANGLNIGFRTATGIAKAVKINDAKPVRFSLNQYGVQLLETTNLATAQNLYKKILGSVDTPYVYSTTIQGQAVYQVSVGPYVTKDNATKARDRISSNAAIAALFKPASSILTGPMYLNAGTYATETEAIKQASVLSSAGIDASLVYQMKADGSISYSAWFGRAADAGQLELSKVQAAKLIPTLATVVPSDTNLPYMVKRTDASLAASAIDTITHYVFQAAATKIWIEPVNLSNFTLKERSNRTYRGAAELSPLNNKLAVVNELPFEFYLYGVVGSELSSGWPIEALKAQAVAARTYALKSGMAYKIAHITDTTLDQAYYGFKNEFVSAINAVKATEGEVITNVQGNLITPLYHSNSGGMTADPMEVWGNPVDYFQSVTSPDDIAQKGLLPWIRVVTQDGTIGYIRSDLLQQTEQQSTTGIQLSIITSDATNLRKLPYVDDVNNPSIAKLTKGDLVIPFEQAEQSSPFTWMRGPFTVDQLTKLLKDKANLTLSSTLTQLAVTQRGPSGRVTEVMANGQTISIKNPDTYRTVFNSLPSNRFDIEETGRYTILGANGVTIELPSQSTPMYVLTSNKSVSTVDSGSPSKIDPLPLSLSNYFLMNKGTYRAVTSDAQYRFVGFGFGHGLGMSQYGAKAFADLGYDYQKILKYYYKDVTIGKD